MPEMAAVLERRSTPPLTAVVPEYVFEPASTSVPGPVLDSLPVPLVVVRFCPTVNVLDGSSILKPMVKAPTVPNVVVRPGLSAVRPMPRTLSVPPLKTSGEFVPEMLASLEIASVPSVSVVVPV